jgi:hypothetical protein
MLRSHSSRKNDRLVALSPPAGRISLTWSSHGHRNGQPRRRPSDPSPWRFGTDERTAARMVVPPDPQHAHHRRRQRSPALAARAKTHARTALIRTARNIWLKKVIENLQGRPAGRPCTNAACRSAMRLRGPMRATQFAKIFLTRSTTSGGWLVTSFASFSISSALTGSRS